MIVRLSGILESIDGNEAVVVPDVPGAAVAYEVLLPAYLAERLGEGGAVGGAVTLHTLQYLESQGQGTSFIPRLIGFASPQERLFFELFTTVKGLGNKRALRALAAEPGRIAGWIATRDTRALTELPEIGKRLAETVVAELSGKVETFIVDMDVRGGGVPPVAVGRGRGAGEPEPGVGSKLSPAAAEAVNALVSLGESRADAERMVARAVARAEEGKSGAGASADTATILQAALSAR